MVLHEFGHALGLIHEHQNPAGRHRLERARGDRGPERTAQQLDREQIRHNVLDHYAPDAVTATDVDRLSIMMYPIPASWTNDGFSADLNGDLSETDIEFIRSVYSGDTTSA